MCGIVAILNFDSTHLINARNLHRMTDTLSHRGPDDSGIWNRGSVGLGHRRLAILDLSSAGNEPMSHRNNASVLTFNGEIYNYRELRSQLKSYGYQFYTQTDTEVILNAYAKWGIHCLSHFNGIFAFALWDMARHRLFVARDRFGVKPLVYYHDATHFVCASEIKALLKDVTIPRDFDPIALHHYLSFMTVPAPLTIYQNIRKLRAGHYLLVEDDQVIEQRWWTLPLGRETQDSEENILEHLDALLHDSIRLRLNSDAPLGTFLSGGVDSSIVSALAAKQSSPKNLHTFSVTFPNQPNYDESIYARQVANHIHSCHTEINLQENFLAIIPEVVQLFDEPFAISSALAVYLMARETSQYVKVILTGDGGDEVFAGYPWRHTKLDKRLDQIACLPFSGLRTLNQGLPKPLVKWHVSHKLSSFYHKTMMQLTTSDVLLRTWMYQQSLYIFNEAEKFTLYTPEWAESLTHHTEYSSTDDFLAPIWSPMRSNRVSHRLHFDLQTSLEYEMLSKVDKATMACGIEARNPLLDYRLVEYALTLPSHMMVQGTNGKRLLKMLGEQYVPHDILYRKKQGFNVPLAAWLRTGLPPILADGLSYLQSSNIFDSKVIAQIVERHQNDSHINLSNEIFTLALFGLWQQENNQHI